VDRAPDFARTVEIHRKPGYDPGELFVDPKIVAPQAVVARKLARRKLGFRTLLDVISLDTSLVKGSHGRMPDREADGPMFATNEPSLVPTGRSLRRASNSSCSITCSVRRDSAARRPRRPVSLDILADYAPA
jgi:hypothetical protein